MRPLKARIQVWFFFLGGGDACLWRRRPTSRSAGVSSPKSSAAVETPRGRRPRRRRWALRRRRRRRHRRRRRRRRRPSASRCFVSTSFPGKSEQEKQFFFSIFISKIDYCRLLLNQRIGLNSFILRYVWRPVFLFWNLAPRFKLLVEYLATRWRTSQCDHS